MVKDGALLSIHLAEQREIPHGCPVVEMVYSSGQCCRDEVAALRRQGTVCRALHNIAIIAFHRLPWVH